MSNKYIAVFLNDTKNTLRDPTLLLLLLVPFLMIMVLRLGFPLLLNYVPQATDYSEEIVSFFALLSAIFPGMIMSFILLDEKDMQLFSVIKVTPATLSGFLFTRLMAMIAVGFVMSFLILQFDGIYSISILDSIQVALLASLNSPILILLVSYIAKNKIEGMTLLKAAMVTLFIPILIFFFDNNWEYILGVFPAFWVYAFFDFQNSWVAFIYGLIYLSFVNFIIFKKCKF